VTAVVGTGAGVVLLVRPTGDTAGGRDFVSTAGAPVAGTTRGLTDGPAAAEPWAAAAGVVVLSGVVAGVC
jgi:hypothetical protein